MKVVRGDQMMYEVPASVLKELYDLRADNARLREAAGWLIGNRGHRGEEQAWKLLADALAAEDTDE